MSFAPFFLEFQTWNLRMWECNRCTLSSASLTSLAWNVTSQECPKNRVRTSTVAKSLLSFLHVVQEFSNPSFWELVRREFFGIRHNEQLVCLTTFQGHVVTKAFFGWYPSCDCNSQYFSTLANLGQILCGLLEEIFKTSSLKEASSSRSILPVSEQSTMFTPTSYQPEGEIRSFTAWYAPACSE